MYYIQSYSTAYNITNNTTYNTTYHITYLVQYYIHYNDITYHGTLVQGSPSGGGHVPPGGDASRMTTTN